MTKARLLLSAKIHAYAAHHMIERVTKQAIEKETVNADDLLEIKVRMQEALCATAKLEQLARGMVEPNEWDA